MRKSFGGRRSEGSRSYSPRVRYSALVGDLDSPYMETRRSSWNHLKQSIMMEILPVKTELGEIKNHQQMFTNQADNMVRVVSDAMAQLKKMQDFAAEHLNVKTEVLKQETELMEKQQSSTDRQVSQLIANAQTVETNNQMAAQKAVLQDSQIHHLDSVNQRMMVEMQQMSEQMMSIQQKLPSMRDDQMKRDIDYISTHPTTFLANDRPNVNETFATPMPSAGTVVFDGSVDSIRRGMDDRNLRQNLQNDGRPAEHGQQESYRGNLPQSTSTPIVTAPMMNHHFPTYLAPIKTPPVFGGSNYNNWKEEIQFWKDIHGHIDDAQLLAELALSAHKVYRPLIMRFMKETKGDKTKRSFGEFMLKMGV